MSILKRVIRDLRKGDNIAIIATVIIAFITAFLKAFGFTSTDVVNSIMLATLGLLAIGFLTMRYRLEDIARSGLVDAADLIRFSPKHHPLLNEYLDRANEIWMLGLQLKNTTINNYDDFGERAKKGLVIRAMIANPEGSSFNAAQVTLRFSRDEPPHLFRAAYDNVMLMYTKIRQRAVNLENINLRLLEYVPPFSLYIFPDEKNGGVAFVEMYGYRSQPYSIPRFMLTEKENAFWYNKFVQQFESMWEDASDYFPDTTQFPE